MAENNTILEKLEGLVSRFEEVSTLIRTGITFRGSIYTDY